MRHPEFTCNHCGSGELRRSRSTSLIELPKILMGKYPFRCLDCKERTWIDLLRRGKQVRCPRCLTVHVAVTPHQRMRASFWQRQLLRMGARAYRCSFCSHRFVTFKKPTQETPETRAPEETQPEPARQMASPASAGR